MRLYRTLLVAATLLALTVIPLGAYVRLSDAGLGCPDWPGCYGHLIGVPDAAHEQAAALAVYPDKPVQAAKAWKEVVHRYLAGSLGLLIAAIATLAWKHRRALPQAPTVPLLLVGVVGAQALLGMLTVTSLLKPVIVSAHLLGGMLTLGLLTVLLVTVVRPPVPTINAYPAMAGDRGGLRRHAALALLAVVLQIALGGWVSSNYAGLACTDFPTCRGAWLPDMDFAQAFQLHRQLGETAAGDPLTIAALLAIQWTHRLGALVVGIAAGTLAVRLGRSDPGRRRWALMLGVLLVVQIGLGIANVLAYLPLAVAVAHTVGAALLLAALLAINLRLAPGPARLPVIVPQRKVAPAFSPAGGDRQTP